MSYLFDTAALIAFFNDEKGADKIGSMLDEVDNGAEGFFSVITLTELGYLYSREDRRRAEEILEQIKNSKLKPIDINERIAVRAGELKKTSVPIADVLIGACAEQANAVVVTDDPHFKSLGIKSVSFR